MHNCLQQCVPHLHTVTSVDPHVASIIKPGDTAGMSESECSTQLTLKGASQQTRSDAAATGQLQHRPVIPASMKSSREGGRCSPEHNLPLGLAHALHNSTVLRLLGQDWLQAQQDLLGSLQELLQKQAHEVTPSSSDVAMQN